MAGPDTRKPEPLRDKWPRQIACYCPRNSLPLAHITRIITLKIIQIYCVTQLIDKIMKSQIYKSRNFAVMNYIHTFTDIVVFNCCLRKIIAIDSIRAACFCNLYRVDQCRTKYSNGYARASQKISAIRLYLYYSWQHWQQRWAIVVLQLTALTTALSNSCITVDSTDDSAEQ